MDELKQIQTEIERARAYAVAFWRSREFIAASLAAGDDFLQGVVNIRLVAEGKYMAGYVVEFPDADVCHVYTTLLGNKAGEAATYRLTFKGQRASAWRGISHPWGAVPGDIPVPAVWVEGDGVRW